MAAPFNPSAGSCVVIHLLDSAQGNALQTWRFSGQNVVTIGRDTDNDIVIADPHVSRAHAKLVRNNGTWTLFSTGRHGTMVNDRLVVEADLKPQTVFRLGASGPMMRFDADVYQPRRTETLEGINPDMFVALEVDESRKQQEVDQITENALFRELLETSKRLRSSGNSEDHNG